MSLEEVEFSWESTGWTLVGDVDISEIGKGTVLVMGDDRRKVMEIFNSGVGYTAYASSESADNSDKITEYFLSGKYLSKVGRCASVGSMI